MRRADWLSLVAVHSDSYLMAHAFFNGARLNREGRCVPGAPQHPGPGRPMPYACGADCGPPRAG